MSLFRSMVLASAALLVSAAAQAAVIVTPTSSLSLRNTNFAAGTTISVPTFDNTLGTLTSVQVALTGTVVSSLGYENRNPATRTVSLRSQAQLTLTRPGGGTLVVALPSQTITRSAGPFDGVIDFAGTSGGTVPGVTATLTNNSGVLTSAADLALFSSSGPSAILLPVAGVGQGQVTGGGNISGNISTQASAGVVVTYTFTEAPPPPPVGVPEPASMALLAAGLFGIGLARRRSA